MEKSTSHNSLLRSGFSSVGLADPPNAAEASRLRKLALKWLTDKFATWMQLMETNPKARAAGIKQLRHWLSDPDLAAVRGKAIDRLPQTERDGWRKLWAEVAKLLDGEPVERKRGLSESYHNIGVLINVPGKWAESMKAYRRALKLLEAPDKKTHSARNRGPARAIKPRLDRN